MFCELYHLSLIGDVCPEWVSTSPTNVVFVFLYFSDFYFCANKPIKPINQTDISQPTLVHEA